MTKKELKELFSTCAETEEEYLQKLHLIKDAIKEGYRLLTEEEYSEYLCCNTYYYIRYNYVDNIFYEEEITIDKKGDIQGCISTEYLTKEYVYRMIAKLIHELIYDKEKLDSFIKEIQRYITKTA